MKNPWQIWSAFALSLVVVLSATIWLTFKTIELESQREEERQQIELARREAELQERVNSALYRMDWLLTPLIAQEAARPYYLYESFYRPPSSMNEESSKSKLARPEEPSPLLIQPSDFVLLHFQINPENKITSPQRPVGKYRDMAILSCGLTVESVCNSEELVIEAGNFSNYEHIKLGCSSFGSNPDSADLLTALQTVYLDPTFNGRFAEAEPTSTPADGNGLLQRFLPEQQLMQQRQDDAAQLGPSGNAFDIQRERGANRGGEEYFQRLKSTDRNTLNQWANRNLELNNWSRVPTAVREGIMRPMWLGEHLVLARRVTGKQTELVQCCWLNWEKIRHELAKEVADILPDVEFKPVNEGDDLEFGKILTTLPVQVVVDSERMLTTLAIGTPATGAAGFSGIRWSLMLAWSGLVFAACAIALLLRGVIRLSERRAAFVSAVTHELRTPLTTFRMYAEMLSEEMVPEEKKKQYALTLKGQADRLSHLVENVLQFARLEKVTQNNAESIPVDQLFADCHDRLVQRASAGRMKLEFRLPEDETCEVKVDLAKLEQIVFNLVDNACKYGGGTSDRIEIGAELRGAQLCVFVQDFGSGFSDAARKKLFEPFCKSDQEAANTAQGVGLGLALCKRMADSFGGSLRLVDSPSGARFELRIPQS